MFKAKITDIYYNSMQCYIIQVTFKADALHCPRYVLYSTMS